MNDLTKLIINKEIGRWQELSKNNKEITEYLINIVPGIDYFGIENYVREFKEGKVDGK